MPYAPTLTPQTDFSPVPRVEVVFTTMHASAVTATVYRVSGNRTYRVRGGINVPAAGGFTINPDMEAPFGVSVSYSAEMFDVSGVSLGFTDPTSTTLSVTGTVLHTPTDPNRNVQVTVLQGTAADLVRPFFGNVVQPQGRTVPVWIGSGRGGLVGVALNFMTATAADEAALYSIFGGYGDNQIPVVCIRTSMNLGLPAPFFALVQEPHRLELEQSNGGESTTWNMPATEAAPPAEAVVLALLTYGDLEVSYATYSAMEGAYLTYLPLESDFSLAGAS